MENREIKFRGWFQGINGQEYWAYGYLVKQTNGNWEITNGETSWTVDNVGQFTGLHDKNGKEIYEGDIVELLGLEDKPRTVIFFNYQWHFERKDFVIDLSSAKPSEIKVIGNIHQNPELLTTHP